MKLQFLALFLQCTAYTNSASIGYKSYPLHFLPPRPIAYTNGDNISSDKL